MDVVAAERPAVRCVSDAATSIALRSLAHRSFRSEGEGVLVRGDHVPPDTVLASTPEPALPLAPGHPATLSTTRPTTTEILARPDTIRRFISEVFFIEGFSDEASFLGEGIVDSTGMLELVLFVEMTYGIEIADDELVPENFDSLNKVVAFIARKARE